MNYIYASLLLHSAGKTINEENVKKVVEATGEKADGAKVKALVAALEGVDIKSAIEKTAMPVAIAPATSTTSEALQKKEEKKEEAEEEAEKKAETAAEGLAALFG